MKKILVVVVFGSVGFGPPKLDARVPSLIAGHNDCIITKNIV